MVGRSDAMQRVEREAILAARGNANVLITGEPGVGKSAIARFIHERSDRSAQGFAIIKCEGLPDLLVESELFGHLRGSFVGAYRDKPGLVESVPGGTIFLDEVGALSAKMQIRLLRFLETGDYQRIGDARVRIQARDVRWMASTSVNLPTRVDAGLFLNDLHDRLNGVGLSVPPLRERRDDIPTLVEHFAAECGGLPEISAAVRDALCRADWPGNVRELKSAVLRQLLSGVSL